MNDNVCRGYLGRLDPATIRAEDGQVVWDNETYAFLDADCPPTAHPGLWRHSQRTAQHGLFEVVPGIYQVRGLDLSNMTLVEGHHGVVVIDPLVSAETAAAALALYRRHRGGRLVTGVVYTHSHVDHFGGVAGVVSPREVAAGNVPVLAPRGFMEHAVSENVYAGPAMARRAAYMFGAALPKGPIGQIGTGLGMTNSTGRVTLIPPTIEITKTGQQETVDGVTMVFQLTPGTEAPAEMNFFFPDMSALCVAENATHTLHNLVTLRGAMVRDPHAWARYLTETIVLFGARADVVFASHHWPTWGRAEVLEFLSTQRDLYAYQHDQTLRLINKGYTGAEIAESFPMPPALAAAWHTHGYYGSISHNVKAIYQRYLGWFDGNPAHLWEHPPAESARRYVECMGGADAVLDKAQRYFDHGDYRWVVQIVHHVIFAYPDNAAARELQASAFERLGHGSENATWRNFYLTGAMELRGDLVGTPTRSGDPGMLAALTVEQVFDSIAIRVDGPRAWHHHISVGWILTDLGVTHLTVLHNGVLTQFPRNIATAGALDVMVTLDRQALNRIVYDPAGIADEVAAGSIDCAGDLNKLTELFSLLDQPDPEFAIVTP